MFVLCSFVVVFLVLASFPTQNFLDVLLSIIMGISIFFKSSFIDIVCVLFLPQDASLFENKCEWVCTDMSKIHLPSVVLSRVTPK